jgi:hypothetical protein
MADKPICQDAFSWLKHRHGRTYLAPLTGQDRRALQAFAHLLELYAVADDQGQTMAVRAMRAVVLAMQPKTRGIARDAVPCVLEAAPADLADLWATKENP